jgi:hypothetical protein
MLYVGFEPTIPASEHALDRAATVTGSGYVYRPLCNSVRFKIKSLKIRRCTTCFVCGHYQMRCLETL